MSRTVALSMEKKYNIEANSTAFRLPSQMLKYLIVKVRAIRFESFSLTSN